jgi:hypothetical protein
VKKLFATLIFSALTAVLAMPTRAIDASAELPKRQDVATEDNRNGVTITDQGNALTERIAIFGDSHVERLGPVLWPMIRMAGGVCQFRKQRGSKAEGWVNSLPLRQWLAKFDPQIVIIVFGTNEAMGGAKTNDLIASFEALAKKTKNGRDRRIIWVSPPKLETPPHLDRVWEALRKTEGIELMDFSESVFNLKPDGIHLELPAYRSWAWEIMDRLRHPQERITVVR